MHNISYHYLHHVGVVHGDAYDFVHPLAAELFYIGGEGGDVGARAHARECTRQTEDDDLLAPKDVGHGGRRKLGLHPFIPAAGLLKGDARVEVNLGGVGIPADLVHNTPHHTTPVPFTPQQLMPRVDLAIESGRLRAI